MPCNDPDHMEMPCLCKCGKWMELNDSMLPPGKDSGETICRECYDEKLTEQGGDTMQHKDGHCDGGLIFITFFALLVILAVVGLSIRDVVREEAEKTRQACTQVR